VVQFSQSIGLYVVKGVLMNRRKLLSLAMLAPLLAGLNLAVAQEATEIECKDKSNNGVGGGHAYAYGHCKQKKLKKQKYERVAASGDSLEVVRLKSKESKEAYLRLPKSKAKFVGKSADGYIAESNLDLSVNKDAARIGKKYITKIPAATNEIDMKDGPTEYATKYKEPEKTQETSGEFITESAYHQKPPADQTQQSVEGTFITEIQYSNTREPAKDSQSGDGYAIEGNQNTGGTTQENPYTEEPAAESSDDSGNNGKGKGGGRNAH